MYFSIRMSSSLPNCLILMVASVVKSPTMIRVTLLCGRALSERALWLLLISELAQHNSGSRFRVRLSERQKGLFGSGGSFQAFHFSAKTKTGRREGDGRKNVRTICDKRHDILRQFATFYDNSRPFVPLT